MGDDDYFATIIPGMVAGLQDQAVKEADQAHQEEREAQRALRTASGDTGVSASELLAQLTEDDPEKKVKALNAEMDRVDTEATAAAKAKEHTDEEIPTDRFPPPIFTTGAS